MLSLPSIHPRLEQKQPFDSGAISRTSLRLKPIGARPDVEPQAEGLGKTVINVYRGRERYEGIATYERVVYRELYPGIDLVYSADGGQLKADWILEPAACVDRIRWRYEGAEGVAIGEDGGLRIVTALGVLTEDPPILYQEGAQGRELVEGSFQRFENGDLGFWVGPFDRTRTLVIDPSLEWSTFLGGSGSDSGQSIALDGTGNVYVAGSTFSADFPVTPGAFDTTLAGISDAFVAKFNPAGALIFSTLIGGSGGESIEGLAVDAAGHIFFAGSTSSSDFPVTGRLRYPTGRLSGLRRGEARPDRRVACVRDLPWGIGRLFL